jgi:hypothetical protein
MSKHVIVHFILLVVVTSSVLASEERAKEVAQPIVAEDAIFLSRVTFVNHHDMSWAGLVDYTCRESFAVNESGRPENRNAASIAGIKTWADPYHFQEQALFGDTVRVYVDLTDFDASRLEFESEDVVAATLECVLVNATASMTGWYRARHDWVTAQHLYVEVRGAPEFVHMTQTYRFADLVGKVPRARRFE